MIFGPGPAPSSGQRLARGVLAVAAVGGALLLARPPAPPAPGLRPLPHGDLARLSLPQPTCLDPTPVAPHSADAGPAPAPERAPLAVPGEEGWLAERLAPLRFRFADVLAHPAQHRLQILVTEVVAGEHGKRRLVRHGYRVDREYFYPASAIKTFVAVAALRRLAELRAESGLAIDRDTPLVLCTLEESDCREGRDPTNLRGGTITVGHEIRKMQLVSSNVAFNRLYDFVGHRELNTTLSRMGFESARLRHRIEGGEPGGRSTPRIELLTPGGSWTIPRRTSDYELAPVSAPRQQIGSAHYDDQLRLVEQPADFSSKNYVSLSDLHDLLIALVLPDMPGAPALGLSPDDRDFLLAAMGEDPLRSANPPYRGPEWAAARYKVMLRGMRQVLPLPWLRYINKGGRAYGFEIENAYVENRHSGRALFVTAVIYANPNEVINDDGYAYTGVSGPFLEALGASLAYGALR